MTTHAAIERLDASLRLRDLTRDLVLEPGRPASRSDDELALEARPRPGAAPGRCGFALQVRARRPDAVVDDLPWRLIAAEGPEHRLGLLDGQGRVVVDDLPPGRYHLAFAPLAGTPLRIPLWRRDLPSDPPPDPVPWRQARSPVGEIAATLSCGRHARLLLDVALPGALGGSGPAGFGHPLVLVAITAPRRGHRLLARGVLGLRGGQDGEGLRGGLDLEGLGGRPLHAALAGPEAEASELLLVPTTTLALARLGLPALVAVTEEFLRTPTRDAAGACWPEPVTPQEALHATMAAGLGPRAAPLPACPVPLCHETPDAAAGVRRRLTALAAAAWGRGASPAPMPGEVAALNRHGLAALLARTLADPASAAPLLPALGRHTAGMRQDDGPSAAAGSPSSSADPRAARNAASRRFRDLTAGLVLRTGVPARVEGEACALEAVPLGAAPDGRSGFALRLLARAPGLVAGLPWQLRSRDGSERRGGLTDAAGRVVVADLPPGDHDLAIEPLRGVPRRFPLRPITLPASLPRAVDHLTLGRADDPLRGVLRSYCQHRLFVTAWLSAAAFGPEPPLRGRPLLVVQIVAPGAGHRILARGIIGLVRSGGGAVRGDLDLEALGGEALLRELSGPGSPGRELHLLPTTTLDLARLAPPLLRAAARDLGASRPHTPEFHAEGTEHRAAQATLEAMARSREAGAACAGVPRPPSPHPGRATTGEVGCEALQGLLRRSADDGRGDSDGPRPWPEELAALEPASRMGLLESLLDDPELAVPLSQACGRALASLRAGAAARLVPPCGSLG